MGVAVTAPVLMLAQLNLRSVLATDEHAEARFGDYRALRMVMLALAAVVIAVTALAAQADAMVVAMAGAMQGVEWASDIYLGLLQRRETMGRMAVSVALRGVLTLAGLAAGLMLTGSLVVALAVATVARVVLLIGLDSRVEAGAVEAAGRGRRMLSLAKTALPLGVVLMLGSFAGNMPRYFTAYYLSEQAVGVFAALVSLGTAANLVVNALGQAATPQLARMHAAGDREGFWRVTRRMLATGVGLALAGVAGALVLGDVVLRVAYGNGFAGEARLLAAVMAACGLGYLASLGGYALTAARQFAVQVPLQVATMAATAIGCAAGIPAWGLTGAAAGIGLGYAVQCAAEAWLLFRALRVQRGVA
jgi:O-antigen/teichoic acid export membrane protein